MDTVNTEFWNNDLFFYEIVITTGTPLFCIKALGVKICTRRGLFGILTLKFSFIKTCFIEFMRKLPHGDTPARSVGHVPRLTWSTCVPVTAES